MSARAVLAAVGLLGGGASLAAGDAPLAQCAAVDDPAARLACYDALAGRPATPTATPSGAAAAPASAAAPAAAPVPVPTAGGDDDFGKPQSEGTLKARIVGKFTQWQKGTVFRLDNGQVWKCVGEGSAVYPSVPENPEVEITHGMMGYRMEIKAIGRRLWVRRVS